MNIRQFFGIQPKLPIETIQAYYNRLPDEIEVSWFRDEDFIVAEIKANGNEFMTQGKGAEDLIDMVNDAVISMEIPQKFVPLMKNTKAYIPPIEEIAKLKNLSIESALISLHKDKKVPQVV